MFTPYLLAGLPTVHPLRTKYLFCHHEDSFSLPVWCWNHHIRQMFSCIWNNLGYWPRKDTPCAPSCVCVCKSMTVNGRNPSTNPHLSSWITDIINRRDSSISPVFPIQRWGAGLFPSLSAHPMTFTKLLYICVEATRTCRTVCLCQCACLTVLVRDALYSPNVEDGFVWRGLLVASQRSWLSSPRAGGCGGGGLRADPQPSTEGQHSSWGAGAGEKMK